VAALVNVTLAEPWAVEDVINAVVNPLSSFICGSNAEELIVTVTLALGGSPIDTKSSRNEFSTQSPAISCWALVIGLATDAAGPSQVRSADAGAVVRV